MLSAIGIIFKKASAPKNKNITQNLNLPAGSTIHSFRLDSNNNLFLLVKNDKSSDKIIIINPQQENTSISEIKLY